jgi:hypothetical protein
MTRSRNCSKQLIIICEIAATIAAVRILPHKFAHNYGTRLWRERGSGLLSSCLYQVYRSRADPSLQTHSFAMIQLKIRCKSCGIVARSHDIENSCSFPTSPTCSPTDVSLLRSWFQSDLHGVYHLTTINKQTWKSYFWFRSELNLYLNAQFRL